MAIHYMHISGVHFYHEFGNVSVSTNGALRLQNSVLPMRGQSSRIPSSNLLKFGTGIDEGGYWFSKINAC